LNQVQEAADRLQNDVCTGRKARSVVVLIFVGLSSFALAGGLGWRLGGSRGREEVPSASARPTSGARAVVVTLARSQARLLYQVHCARCHGASGRGDGPDAPLLKSRPRDFVLAGKDTRRDPSRIRNAIADGVPGTPMTAFGPILSARELDLLVDQVGAFTVPGRGTEFADRSHDAKVTALARAGFAAVPKRPAAPLELRGGTGENVSLNDLRGRLVLVVFWGTTCSACLEELPDLHDLAERYADRGLRVLAVCVEQAAAGDAFQVAHQRASRLKVYTDTRGSARLGYDIQALPTAVLIDPSGDLLGTAAGAKKWSSPEVRSLIEACLTERGAL
jgi:thiol-disulfide isomerase/thioredoxin/cytochrome c553